MKPWIALLVAAPLTLGAVGAATLLSADTATAPVDNSLKVVNHPYVSAQVRVDPTVKSVHLGVPMWPKYDELMNVSEARLHRYIRNHHLEDVITIVGCHVMQPGQFATDVVVEVCGGRVDLIQERRGDAIVQIGTGGVATRSVYGSVSVAQPGGVSAEQANFDGLLGFTQAKLNRFLEKNHLEDYIGVAKCGEFSEQNAVRPVTVEICGGHVTGVMQRLPNGSYSVAQS